MKAFQEVMSCQKCSDTLPLPPKPILQGKATARLLIIGQAPGIKAHNSNKPWNDASGERLREWTGLADTDFYDPEKVALIPMAFCYPGKGNSGDLPPPKICAPTWHEKLIGTMHIQLRLLVGQYAQGYYLQDKLNLTERVKNWRNYINLTPSTIVLPHPSPRNNIWLKRQAWFEREVIPELKAHIQRIF